MLNRSRLQCPQTSLDLLAETNTGKTAQLAHQLSLSTGQLTYVVQLTRTKQLTHHTQLSLKTVRTTVFSRNNRTCQASSAPAEDHHSTGPHSTLLPANILAVISKTACYCQLSSQSPEQHRAFNSVYDLRKILRYHSLAHADQLRSCISTTAHRPQDSAYCSSQITLASLSTVRTTQLGMLINNL
ncbi:hypothetical protein F511_41214 [Dorcoceras hygrometricum]|uniref:Uncharacterized protein n=1 Tax=Dorcoceras hygrometricum TaxID=472368 RepID=A0A2Z7CHN5_9LAMI|nr:hypothetical protein F511_41214 [Dorcoceras hygrometricum]